MKNGGLMMESGSQVDPKQAAAVVPEIAAEATISRPRLVKLIIRNFRCIGNEPVTIDLDDIVVLVGPNNVGKSTILRAYEVVMSEGSAEGQLALDDFPDSKIDPSALPQIELHTVVFDSGPGDEWTLAAEGGGKLVRERWTWNSPGAPFRRGFNVSLDRWATDADPEKMPWGAPGVANARRPQAHSVDAFASPDAQAGEIVKLLMLGINERVKGRRAGSKEPGDSDFASLLAGIASLQKKIVEESQDQIDGVQKELTGYVQRVFPGHCVVFDARPEEDLEKALNLFKANPQLLMGPEGGYLSSIGRQGSGARRTLLWTALRLLADSGTGKKIAAQRPQVLLLDEPEICLHPSAIREACDVLYGLPAATGNWQVMVTTHSPSFVDFARDHTSIVRVERKADGEIAGTTIFRPGLAQFDGDDRDRLKLLNICDPYVAEFFFGGRTVVVEGDTEYAAFRHVIATQPEQYQGVHIVRARGKATIVSLCKILNQFGCGYSVLHDSDRPTCLRLGKLCANPSWKLNDSIREESSKSPDSVRLVASVPNFEGAYLGLEVTGDKPYNALEVMKASDRVFIRIKGLLDSLLDATNPLPDGAVAWQGIADLEEALHCGSKNGEASDAASLEDSQN
jgi:putative ATP-dependent endonuclease of OLD family